MDLVKEKLGAEGEVDLSFADGKLKFELKYAGQQADAGAFVALKPDMFLDKLKAAIPGQIDDMIIDALKAAFMPKA